MCPAARAVRAQITTDRDPRAAVPRASPPSYRDGRHRNVPAHRSLRSAAPNDRTWPAGAVHERGRRAATPSSTHCPLFFRPPTNGARFAAEPQAAAGTPTALPHRGHRCRPAAIIAARRCQRQSKIFNWRKVGNFQLALTRRGRGSLITASDDADGAPYAAASLSHRGGGNGGLRCRAAPVVFRLGSAAPNGRGSRASRGPRRQFTRGGVPAHPGFAIYPDQSAQSGHHKHGHLP
jgi:hypothetical protein